MLDDLPYPTPMPFSFDVSNLLRTSHCREKRIWSIDTVNFIFNKGMIFMFPSICFDWEDFIFSMFILILETRIYFILDFELKDYSYRK